MSALVEFRHVTKHFVLRRPQTRSVRGAFIEMTHRLAGRGSPRPKELFTALSDVSFGITRGETVGVIGENGSGKSTILKLVARILEPTAGQVEVHGRVAALLELGAGFHGELTGRENIYLNGSILGMRQKDIDRRLDEIVAFTEIAPFIDVPVKHYSSGMYMRLAFSIAVHVEPEILLVDEVLAVGDYNFQRKCFERIHSLQRDGVTVILVSHDLDSVRKLCSRVLWLDRGDMREDGGISSVIEHYVSYEIAQQMPATSGSDEGRFGSHEVEIAGVEFLNAEGRPQDEFHTGDTLVARIHYEAHQAIPRPVFGIAIYRADGMHISGPNTDFSGYAIPSIAGRGCIDVTIDALPFLEGNYTMSAAVYDEARIHPYDSHERRYQFRIVPGGVRDQYGLVHLPVRWKLGVNGHE